MKKILPLSFLLLAFFSANLFAQIPLPTSFLKTKIDELTRVTEQVSNIGIMVQNADTGQVIYQKNPDRFFAPASNEKLFVSLAALRYLGSNFIFPTKLFVEEKEIDGIESVKNLYLKFSGNPVLTFNQLDRLIKKLPQKNIKKISGDVFIDDFYFEQPVSSPGTTWEDQKHCFAAPLGALMLHHNCVVGTLKPSKKVGGLAHLKQPHYPQFIPFKNRVKTIAKNSKKFCKVKTSFDPDLGYVLTGCIKADSPPDRIEMAIPDPRQYFSKALQNLLKRNGIAFHGKIKFKKLNTNSLNLIGVEESPPVSKMVELVLKDSDNTVADVLFKMIGFQYFKKPGTWKNGEAAVKKILNDQLQLNLSKSKLIDGSGLSRYSVVTPRQTVQLLQKVWDQNQDGFISALAVSGKDGTLKNRMRDPSTKGKVKAKTGTMTGITSLSGYVETANNKTLVFAIYINGFAKNSRFYKKVEDQIASVLAAYQP